MRGGARAMLAAVMLAASAAGPALADPPATELRPGSGIVKRDGPAPRRRDAARQAAAKAKRERKNVKRWGDAWRCWGGGNPRRRQVWPFTEGVNHGQ